MKVRTASALALLLVVALATLVRVGATFANPSFDRARPEGQLLSDPALLYYLTQRIVDGGGLPPDDFRADPRVEHPETSDLAAMFTVGQEFYLAWTYLLFGRGMPLHAFSVIAMGLAASLAAVGVWGLTLELTGRVRFALFAAAMYAVTRANYRTVGFILMNEDFSLPLLALHLWLLARAVRVRSSASYVLAALALAAAASTWHAMTFVVALEAAAVFLWYLRSGQNPLSAARAWLFPANLAVASLVVPVLRAKLFLFSLPMQVLAALLVLAAVERHRPLRGPTRVVVAAGIGLALFAASLAVVRAVAGDTGDYAHVFDLMWSKVRFLGRLPADPAALSFDARLLWQGPFETGSPLHLLGRLWLLAPLLALAIAAAAPGWLRGRGDGRTMTLAAFALLGTVAALLVSRLVVLDGLVAPVAAAVLLSRAGSGLAWMLGLALVQAALFFSALPQMVRWSWAPPVERQNLARFLEWTRVNLGDREAIATDFVNSAAILAHTEHAVIVQPKYETRRSRQRIETFVSSFFRDSPSEFRRLLRERFDCRYLLVDTYVMNASRYQAGLRAGERPPPTSAAAAFLSPNARVFTAVPGFRLIYSNDRLSPTWRLYRIE